MKDEINKAAILFAEDSGYTTDEEKQRLIFNFTEGANYILEKMFKMYLNGKISFEIELS